MTKDDKRWMRVEEAAVYSNMGVSLIRKLIKEHKLPAIQGRYFLIDRVDLDACLENLKTESKAGAKTESKDGHPPRRSHR